MWVTLLLFKGQSSHSSRALGLLESPSEVSLVSHCQIGNQYKQRVSLSIYHTITHTQLQRITEREEVVGTRERENTVVGRSSYYFGVFLLVLILSLRKLRGFLLYGFPKENICVYCLLCLIAVIFILSVKDPKCQFFITLSQHYDLRIFSQRE